MRIHVVEPGETLWLISQRYGISIESISVLNELEYIPYLVPGQALVVPTREFAYRVRPGDTLWTISRRFGASVESIASLNNIANPALIYPGIVLRIPEPSKNYGYLEVNAYIEPVPGESEAGTLLETGEYLTYISPFSYQVSEDASLTPLKDEPILRAARQQRAAPLMVITNFRNGNFDSELVHTLLVSQALQEQLLANVVEVMRNKGYYGLNIDFERIPPEDRELYNSFLRRAAAVLRPLNYLLTTALAPKPFDIKTGEWHGAHDYQDHGQTADFVILMTYEWGWSGGPPMAVAPINEVRKVIQYAVSVMPPAKIMMGMPLYGYDWTLPFTPGRWAVRVSPQEAVQLAARYGAEIRYDETA